MLELAESPPRLSRKVATVAAPMAARPSQQTASSGPRTSQQSATPHVTFSSPVAVAPAPSAPSGFAPASAPAARASLFDGSPKRRLLAGLAVALIAGFVAAHGYASFAEDRYVELRRAGESETAAVTQDDYQHQLTMREDAIRSLAAAHRRVAISAGAIWLAVGFLTAYTFFRIVPSPED
jgi:hypothetical protein